MDTQEAQDTTQSKVSPSHLTEEELAARQAAMDKLVPALDPSEYGKMPPLYHSNSQWIAPVKMKTNIRDTSDGHPTDASSSMPSRPIRPPILPRNVFDGVDSDDESDEDDPVVDEEDEEEQPQVVGEVEIDMGEEEDEFIEFARHALGVSDEQWKEILEERRERGGTSVSTLLNGQSLIPCYSVRPHTHCVGKCPREQAHVSVFKCG